MSSQQESFAGDIYRINNPESLVTASHEDLATFMALNARQMKQAVRDMYRRLESEGRLFNLQPGARVKVVGITTTASPASSGAGESTPVTSPRTT